MFTTVFTKLRHSSHRNVLVFDPVTKDGCEDQNIADLIATYQALFPTGLCFSDSQDLQQTSQFLPLRSTQAYLGMTTTAVLFDIRTGFPLDYFLSISATIAAGGILVLIMGKTLAVDESVRFHQEAIETPFFHDFLQETLWQYAYHWQDHHLTAPKNVMKINNTCKHAIDLLPVIEQYPKSTAMNGEQLQIFNAFLKEERGIFTLFSARGTGKSWLASQIIASNSADYILTAPNQNAINQYQWIESCQFKAPDALFLTIPDGEVLPKTLIIEEAGKMPLSHLERLCRRFQKVLMISSVDNYEGTGQGLREKIDDLVPIKYRYRLSELHRFSDQDPLKLLGDRLMFVLEGGVASENTIPIDLHAITLRYYDDQNITSLRNNIAKIISLYHLLNKTHYQTNVQDIRRLLDAPQQVFVLAYKGTQLIGAIWAIEEGGLTPELTQDVFKGLRRPKGNLVAQMLTSQSYFPEAMLAQSIRVSRISVLSGYRRQGIGSMMMGFLEQYIVDNRPNIDFISVSFGLTRSLLIFWESLDYQCVHLGFHLDKTTGLYAAVVLKTMRPENTWITEAIVKFEADAALNLKYKTYKNDIREILRERSRAGIFDTRDQSVINAFELFKRGKHTIENALIRLECEKKCVIVEH